MATEAKVKKKSEIERERLANSARRDSISLLKNLIRLYPKEADSELRNLRKTKAQAA